MAPDQGEKEQGNRRPDTVREPGREQGATVAAGLTIDEDGERQEATAGKSGKKMQRVGPLRRGQVH